MVPFHLAGPSGGCFPLLAYFILLRYKYFPELCLPKCNLYCSLKVSHYVPLPYKTNGWLWCILYPDLRYFGIWMGWWQSSNSVITSIYRVYSFPNLYLFPDTYIFNYSQIIYYIHCHCWVWFCDISYTILQLTTWPQGLVQPSSYSQRCIWVEINCLAWIWDI
jgi:hypothetical protein